MTENRVPKSGVSRWLSALPVNSVTTWLAVLALGLPAAGACWVLVYAFSTAGPHWSYVGVGMLTALAALLAGLFAGFLVGIPKIVSSGQLHLKAGMFSPSTNLAEISDWLTKLLLGAGLVSLSHLGGPVARLIDSVAGGLHAASGNPADIQAAKVFAGATIIAFTVLGALEGYIVTSTWYQKKVSEIANAGGAAVPPP